MGLLAPLLVLTLGRLVAGFTVLAPRSHRGQVLRTQVEDDLREALKKKNEDLSSLTQPELLELDLNKELSPAALAKLTDERPFASLIFSKAVEALDDLYFGSLAPDDAPAPRATREKVVILGSGWGSYAFVSALDADKYDVTIVSPRNYFLFTPMLAGAAVGTVEYRSITQPIREANPGVDYLEATCTDIDTDKKVISCEAVKCAGTQCEIDDFSVPYDHLIIGVGATVNTFGIPGVMEHCNFLKQIEDAAQLRRGIGNIFERANVPGLSDAQRKAALTFAVIGAGPTGVEFCGELCDFIQEDVPRFYPDLLPFVRVKLIEASDRVLMAFDDALQQNALEVLESRRVPARPGSSVAGAAGHGERLVEVMLKAGVKEVKAEEIVLADNTSIPYGMAVWAAGIGPLPLVLDLTKRVAAQEAGQSVARGRLVVDKWLRVKGAPGVWSIGDCACMEDRNYPATAQVASQQGSFLARLFSRNFDVSSSSLAPARVGPEPKGLAQKLSDTLDGDAAQFAKGFQFLNLGILAYLGNSQALAQVQVDKATVKGTGVSGYALWRSVYLSKQVSWRNRILVAVDWAKTRAFGRDLTRL